MQEERKKRFPIRTFFLTLGDSGTIIQKDSNLNNINGVIPSGGVSGLFPLEKKE